MSSDLSYDSLLTLLTDMGVDPLHAKTALIKTKASSLDSAFEWLDKNKDFDYNQSNIESANTSNVPISSSNSSNDESPSYSHRKQYKMVLCVRQDLNMRGGKIPAQCVHAALGVHNTIEDESELIKWEECGEPVICLKINSEEELLELEKKADDAKLPNYVVVDAGRTQIAEGSMTVLAIGPADSASIDKITGHLKLF